MQPIAKISGALLAVTLLTGLPGSAAADATSKTFRAHRGRIVFDSAPLGEIGSEEQFAELVRKARRNKHLRRKDAGSWRFHFLAFLQPAPRATKVNLVWYRLGGKRPEQVDFTTFVVTGDQRTLAAKTTLTKLQGFKPGDRLEARITRLIRKREKVYARCRLTLQ